MKRKILTILTLTIIVGFCIILSSCNSGSKNNADSAVPVQKSTREIVQGVFEYLALYQGYFILLDNHYLFLWKNPNGKTHCSGGSYMISRETITNTNHFATLSNTVGNLLQWKAELSGDTLKAIILDKDGNITRTVEGVRKVGVNNELLNQMNDFEGVFQYTAPLYGQSVMLGGYYIYLAGNSDSTMSANGGTYKYNDNIITCIQKYSTDPQPTLGEFRWMNKSETSDTLHWAVINASNEITSSGKSVRPK